MFCLKDRHYDGMSESLAGEVDEHHCCDAGSKSMVCWVGFDAVSG